MKEKQIFIENARVRKFCDENEQMFFDELIDENILQSYSQIFDKYNQRYIDFAVKFNADQRNLYVKIDPASFKIHFEAVEA